MNCKGKLQSFTTVQKVFTLGAESLYTWCRKSLHCLIRGKKEKNKKTSSCFQLNFFSVLGWGISLPHGAETLYT